MTFLAQHNRDFAGGDTLQTHDSAMYALHPILGGEGSQITPDGGIADIKELAEFRNRQTPAIRHQFDDVVLPFKR
jgi:hypothetical protein